MGHSNNRFRFRGVCGEVVCVDMGCEYGVVLYCDTVFAMDCKHGQ